MPGDGLTANVTEHSDADQDENADEHGLGEDQRDRLTTDIEDAF